MQAEDLPPDAAVLMDFLNTLDERSFAAHGQPHTGGEELIAPLAVARWLGDRGLLNGRCRATEGDVKELVALRHALREALAARAGNASVNVIDATNALLAALPVSVQLDADGTSHLIAATHGVTAPLTEILARVVAGGEWRRLRMCAAPDCRWVFFDTSRNAGGRWCSMAVCGNRDKTRRYRRRRASTAH